MLKPATFLLSTLTAATLGLVATAAPSLAQSPPLVSQILSNEEIFDLGRARNLARQAAERANGGLGQYRAEPAMHGGISDAPFQDMGDHWLFTFRGMPPGSMSPFVESDVRVDKGSMNVSVLYNGPVRSATGPVSAPAPAPQPPASPEMAPPTSTAPDGFTTVAPEPISPMTPVESMPAQSFQAESFVNQPAPAAPPAMPVEATSTTIAPPTNIDEIFELSRARNLARQAAERVNGGLSLYRAEPSMHSTIAEAPYRDMGDHWLFTFRGMQPGSMSPFVESDVRIDKGTTNVTVVYNGPLR